MISHDHTRIRRVKALIKFYFISSRATAGGWILIQITTDAQILTFAFFFLFLLALRRSLKKKQKKTDFFFYPPLLLLLRRSLRDLSPRHAVSATLDLLRDSLLPDPPGAPAAAVRAVVVRIRGGGAFFDYPLRWEEAADGDIERPQRQSDQERVADFRALDIVQIQRELEVVAVLVLAVEENVAR